MNYLEQFVFLSLIFSNGVVLLLDSYHTVYTFPSSFDMLGAVLAFSFEF